MKSTLAQITKFKYIVQFLGPTNSAIFYQSFFLDLKTRMDYFADPAQDVVKFWTLRV